MRKEGYSERFMGGLIAAAADAAQLDPPVMGMVAFFMAEYLRISYIKVCVAAILPSFFYYFSLYSFTHLGAIRKGIRPSPPPEENMPPLWKLLIKQWHVIVSCTFLVIMMATEATTVRQALMISTGLLLVTGFLRKDTRPTFNTLRYSVVETAKSMVAMAPVCAAAGIILGCFSMTGLDYKFTAEITDIAGQSMLLLLLLASVASFILGTGMPTLPAYILVVLTVAPTLISMGIPPLVVHMFIFYQCLTAMLTLPAGLNIYAVAPMVKCSIWQIGISAIGIGAARYIIPFFFIYRPGLLIIGASWVDVLVDTLLCFLVIMAISFTQARYGVTYAKWLEIFAALIGSFFLFYPYSNLPIPAKTIGAVLVALALISQMVRFYIVRTHSLTNNAITLKT
jgi:TRAP transporter 4TM/12TM fusion protein